MHGSKRLTTVSCDVRIVMTFPPCTLVFCFSSPFSECVMCLEGVQVADDVEGFDRGVGGQGYVGRKKATGASNLPL